jgi:hypothetical protein
VLLEWPSDLCANVFTDLGARFGRSLDGHDFAALGYSKMLVDPRVTVTYTKAEYVALSNARFDVSSYSLRRTDLFANKAQETRCSLRLNRATKPRNRSQLKPREGFLRDVGASASRAVRSSPRPCMLCMGSNIIYNVQRRSSLSRDIV